LHLFVVIDDCAADVEQRDHLGHVGIDDEGVDFTGGLENVHAFVGDPIVLKIPPGAANHVAVYRGGVAVAAEDAGARDAKQVDPLAVDRVQQQRPEPDVGGLRNPEAVVVGEGGRARSGMVRVADMKFQNSNFRFQIADFGLQI
jgi:hypothetical protein